MIKKIIGVKLIVWQRERERKKKKKDMQDTHTYVNICSCKTFKNKKFINIYVYGHAKLLK